MYAVDDQRSLERLYDEVDNALKFVESETFVWAMIGNKADLRPEIEEASAKAFSNQIGAKIYFYTSAKTGYNVTQSMTALIETLHRKHTVARQGHSGEAYKGYNKTVKLPDATEQGGVGVARTPAITSANSMKTKCCD